MIFFNHIPKSGGTSLGSSLQECFDYEEVFTGLTLQRLGWTDGRAGEYIRLAPQAMLDSFKFVGGHLGEPIRKELFSDRFSIALARDPRSRFVSLIRHFWRDAAEETDGIGISKFFRLDKTIHINDHDEFMLSMLKTTLMMYFVNKHWQINDGDHWETQWDRALNESIPNVAEYDLCITTENLAFYETFIREALGSPSAAVRERLNAAETVGDTAGDAIKQELGEIWDKYFTKELEFYNVYKTKSDKQRAAIEADRDKWLYWMRSRLAPKQTSWTMDWDAPIKGRGWSERELPAGEVYAGRTARIIIANKATCDIHLEGGLEYKLRSVFWVPDASVFRAMTVTVNGNALPVSIEQPHMRAQQNVVVQGSFFLPSSASFTRIEYNFGEKPKSDIWCLDMSVTLHTKSV